MSAVDDTLFDLNKRLTAIEQHVARFDAAQHRERGRGLDTRLRKLEKATSMLALGSTVAAALLEVSRQDAASRGAEGGFDPPGEGSIPSAAATPHVAQSEERPVVDGKVAGSNPVVWAPGGASSGTEAGSEPANGGSTPPAPAVEEEATVEWVYHLGRRGLQVKGDRESIEWLDTQVQGLQRQVDEDRAQIEVLQKLQEDRLAYTLQLEKERDLARRAHADCRTKYVGVTSELNELRQNIRALAEKT